MTTPIEESAQREFLDHLRPRGPSPSQYLQATERKHDSLSLIKYSDTEKWTLFLRFHAYFVLNLYFLIFPLKIGSFSRVGAQVIQLFIAGSYQRAWAVVDTQEMFAE